jgi:hypothetical protein
MAKRVFEDIKLTWKGTEYVIPSHHVMKALGRIEDHITLAELMQGMNDRKPKFSKIASAYGSVLRFCGCQVEDEEIYHGMLHGVSEEDETAVPLIAQALMGLLSMMMPPRDMQAKTIEMSKSGESERPPPSPRVGASASRRRTRQPTAGD